MLHFRLGWIGFFLWANCTFIVQFHTWKSLYPDTRPRLLRDCCCCVLCVVFFFILLSCFVCVSFFFRYSYAFLCHFSLFTRFVLFIEPYVTEPISTATHRTRATYVTIHLTAIYHRYTYWYWWLWLIRTLIHVQRFQSTAAVCFFSLLHRCDYWETFISIEH